MERNARHRPTSRSAHRRRTISADRLVRPDAALQVFLFRGDDFMGAELFGPQDPVLIGRHPSASLRLEADTVSRRHCRLTWVEGALHLEDLGSGNGTHVNEARLRGTRCLRFHDTIRVGPFFLKARVLDGQSATPVDPIVAMATTRIEAVRNGADWAWPDAPTFDRDERIRDLNELLDSLDTAELLDGGPPTTETEVPIPTPHAPTPIALVGLQPPRSPPKTERVRPRSTVHRSRPHAARLLTPTEPRPANYSVDSKLLAGSEARSPNPRIEISARSRGRLVNMVTLRECDEQYILGHRTAGGVIAPARQHLGLRLIKINHDGTVDLVFPNDVGGHLIRGPHTVSLQSLTEGRKYSCLRLNPGDIATVYLGQGRDCVSYHLRFLRRPASMIRTLKRPTHT